MAKISIITATYNAAPCLETLIQSVLNQKNADFEFLIIDGGSKDNTVDIIKKYSSCISYWISEPDNGIYDAWNKGILKATGEWIMFLGADDMLMPDALEKYALFLRDKPDAGSLHLVSSKRKMLDKNDQFIRVTGYSWEWPVFLNFMTVSHPGALHSKKLFKEYGLFDTKFKITGDYELLLRPRDKLKTAFMDNITVKMKEGGASDSIKAILEYHRAITVTGGASKFKALTDTLINITKFTIKKTLRKLGFNVYLKKDYSNIK